jgi:hypothetical protein
MNNTAHPNAATLATIYADLTRLADYADDDIVLHQAERAVGDPPCMGKQAAIAKEHALLRATGGTLVMDVHHIAANDYFGAVLGILRTPRIAMPFCGLWRFRNGRVIEHWENAYDPSVLVTLLHSTANER